MKTDLAGAPLPQSNGSMLISAMLFLATLASTLYVGANMRLGHSVSSAMELASGWTFAVPLLSILLAHELGHYVVGRRHGVDISLPYFIPAPIFLLGTMGAVIRVRSPFPNRNALCDVGAAGPLAGLIVALPVLAFGIATSEVGPRPLPGSGALFEGHSLLYQGLLFVLKGPIGHDQDILLNETAFAGWAGLLVTMMNLVPVGQLDGGHVASALLGDRFVRISRLLPVVLVAFGLAVSALHVAIAVRSPRGPAEPDFLAGVHWVVWGTILFVLRKQIGQPTTPDETLSPGRRILAVGTLLLFVLLFMPSWLRID